MPRAVEEWVAKNDDQAIPQRVKLRIWEREDGRCYLSGRKIMPGDAYEFEHRIALENGGEHRESNIFLALKDKHKVKTKADGKTKKKITRQRARNIGIKRAKRPFPNRGWDKRFRKKLSGEVVPR